MSNGRYRQIAHITSFGDTWVRVVLVGWRVRQGVKWDRKLFPDTIPIMEGTRFYVEIKLDAEHANELKPAKFEKGHSKEYLTIRLAAREILGPYSNSVSKHPLAEQEWARKILDLPIP